MSDPLLIVEGLTVSIGGTPVLRDVNLKVATGESYGVVGESGSGKTTLAMAVLQHLPVGAKIDSGRISLGNVDLQTASEGDRRSVWRRKVRLVPQDPGPSLNPAMRVGEQIREAVPRGHRVSALDLLAEVGMNDPRRVAGSYPHQLSGGMQQRVLIAMALAAQPEVLVMDEPTTNLDVTTEASILDLVLRLVRERHTALLYVSHSLGVVASLCDRVAVLYAGELVEDARTRDLYEKPLHPYTKGLLDSVPRLGHGKHQRSLRPIPGRVPAPGERPAGCVFAPRCPAATDYTREVRPEFEELAGGRSVRCHRWREIASGEVDSAQPPPVPAMGTAVAAAREGAVLAVESLTKTFGTRRSLPAVIRRKRSGVRAVDGVDLELRPGTTLGLVGESGSGKSTLAMCIAGLEPFDSGRVLISGEPAEPLLSRRPREILSAMQMVFQDPAEALNPHLTVAEALARPLARLAGISSAGDLKAHTGALLSAVGLPVSYAYRRPAALSGGERQRVAIARAFAAGPEIVLLDESVSSLDASVQGLILNLLADLQAREGSAYLFISHDLAAVGYLADDIAVLYRGRVMEQGPAAEVFTPPFHPYTEALLSAVPLIHPLSRKTRIELDTESHRATKSGRGCPFADRCPRFLGDICLDVEPPWRMDPTGKGIYCHIPLDELAADQEPALSDSEGTGGDRDG